MTSASSIAVLDDVKIFDIPKSTQVVVRLDDLRCTNFQECIVARRDADTVAAWFRDYGGSAFTLEIDLRVQLAALTWPDGSRRPQPAGMAGFIAGKIREMLTMRQSNQKIHVTRCVTPLKHG